MSLVVCIFSLLAHKVLLLGSGIYRSVPENFQSFAIFRFLIDKEDEIPESLARSGKS